jgi:hypothetical protein
MIHHCIGPNPEHGVYRDVSESVRAAAAFLNDPETAPKEIDVSSSVSWLIIASYCDMCFAIETGVSLSAYGYGF